MTTFLYIAQQDATAAEAAEEAAAAEAEAALDCSASLLRVSTKTQVNTMRSTMCCPSGWISK